MFGGNPFCDNSSKTSASANGLTAPFESLIIARKVVVQRVYNISAGSCDVRRADRVSRTGKGLHENLCEQSIKI